MRRVTKAGGLAICVIVTVLVGFGPAFGAQNNSNEQSSKSPTWTIEKTVPSMEESSTLNAVSCSAATECASFGQTANPDNLDLPLVGQWTGRSWSYDAAPPPGISERDADGAGFDGASCVSATTCFAVGWMSSTGGDSQVESLAAEVDPEASAGSQVTYLPGAQTGTPAGPAKLYSISCVDSSDCVAVGTKVPTSGPEPPLVEVMSAGTWTIETTPTLASNAGFSGVFCLSVSNCTAVGYNGDAPLAEVWNGSEWAVEGTPSPTGSTSASLSSVSCSSSNSCLAVGKFSTSSGTGSLAEVWDGITWQIDETPEPSGATTATLTGLSCRSNGSCEAVGDYSTGTESGTFADQWNGSTWALQSTPQSPRGASALNAVNCSQSALPLCVAVGDKSQSESESTGVSDEISGSSWSAQNSPIVSIPINELTGISCPESLACEAVGINGATSSFGPDGQGVVEGWAGKSWKLQTTTILELDQFEPLSSPNYGVSCAGGTLSCISAGAGTQTITAQPEYPVGWLEAWNGTGDWSLNPGSTGEGTYEGVSCYAADQCEVVGSQADGTAYVVQIQKNLEPKNQKAPSPAGASDVTLSAVSCPSKKDCLAVGSYVDSDNATTELSELWNGSSWQIEALPAPDGATSSTLDALSCRSANACLAGGSYSISSGQPTALAYSWNGATWTLEAPSAPKSSDSSEFDGISCVVDGHCLAVGSYGTASVASTAFVESWNGTRWKLEPVTVPSGATGSNLLGVSCLVVSSADSCTAVGSWSNDAGNFPLAETATIAEP